MTALLFSVVMALSLGTPFAQVDDFVGDRAPAEQDNPKAKVKLPEELLKKAIEAHGGKENILKPRKGTVSGHDKAGDDEVTFKEIFDLPRQWKRTTTSKDDVFTTLKVGDDFWEWHARGPIRKSINSKYELEPLFGCLRLLVDFTGDGFTLRPLGKEMVNEETTGGVHVEWQKTSVDCYFSEKTGLLLRWDNVFELEPGVKVIEKTLFSDHKQFDGVKVAYRRIVQIQDKKLGKLAAADYVIDELRITEDLPKDSFVLPKREHEKDGDAGPKKVLNKAIEAHGGKENILKPRKGTLSSRLKLAGDGEVTFKEVFDLPQKWRETITSKDNVGNILRIGDEVWEWDARGPIRRAKSFEESHFGYLKGLVVFTGEGFTLRPLDKVEKVNGETTVGIHVERQNTSVVCFFSEKTGLLLRWDKIAALQSGTRVSTKTVFGDHRQFDGVKLPYLQIVYLRDKKMGDLVIKDLEITKDLPKDSFIVPKREHNLDDVASLKQVLKKAIEAHGGKENILKPRKGTLSGHDKAADGEVTFKEVFDLPRQWKQSMTLKNDVGTTLKIGDEVWEWHGTGAVRKPDDAKYIREPHFGILKSLVDFTNEGYELRPLDDEKVNGEKTVGVWVEWEQMSVACYFSEKTGLLSRWDNIVKLGNDKETEKMLFDDHRQFDGVKLPYRRIWYARDKKLGEFVVADFVIDDLRITKDLPEDSFVLPKR